MTIHSNNKILRLNALFSFALQIMSRKRKLSEGHHDAQDAKQRQRMTHGHLNAIFRRWCSLSHGVHPAVLHPSRNDSTEIVRRIKKLLSKVERFNDQQWWLARSRLSHDRSRILLAEIKPTGSNACCSSMHCTKSNVCSCDYCEKYYCINHLIVCSQCNRTFCPFCSTNMWVVAHWDPSIPYGSCSSFLSSSRNNQESLCLTCVQNE